ncbi:ATP synthase subunit I [soil metagenome]
MTNELIKVILSAVSGLLLGSIFFGGLWWTIRESVSCKNPALLFMGSLLLRTGLVLGGFYLACASDWLHLVICLLGFVTARRIVMDITRLPPPHQLILTEGRRHAP